MADRSLTEDWADYERRNLAARYAYAQRYNPTGKHLRSVPIRKWAQENGYDVAPRGPVADLVVDAYEQENGSAS